MGDSWFSPDYFAAREIFCRESSGLYHEEILHPLKLDGKSLVLDLVRLGRPDATRVLVLQSAVHGAEGFAGSAVQSAWLNSSPDLPEDVAVYLLHALNPHGFAKRRRVDHEGIDLNRNFLPDYQNLPQNPGYQALRPALFPKKMDVASEKELEDFRKEYTQAAFDRAWSGGQYEDPQGTCFGGKGPSWSRRVLEEIVGRHHLDQKEFVAILDFHTGLGPHGYAEMICDHPLKSRGLELARDWYGKAVTSSSDGSSSSEALHGLIDSFWQRLLPETCCFVTVEYGTDSLENLFRVLREDHWLHQRQEGEVSDEEASRIRCRLAEHFNPNSTIWQQKVLEQGLFYIECALKGLKGLK